MDVILLAAGRAERFGENKLLMQIGGKAVCSYTIEQFKGLGQRRIMVSSYEEILEYAQKEGYRTVKNERSDLGISHSIALGISALKNMRQSEQEFEMGRCTQDGILFAVCDQPMLKRSTVERMMEMFSRHPQSIVCLTDGQKRGNPVIFSDFYLGELECLEGDTGGRQVMRRHPEKVLEVVAEDFRELLDIDTLGDYRKLAQMFEKLPVP